MVRPKQPAGRRLLAWSPLVGAIALSAGVLTFVGPSGADLASLAAGGDGQSASISVVGAAPITSGPAPTVSLPPSGQSVNAGAPSSSVRGSDTDAFGGRFLDTAALSVAAQGTAGWSASTGTATVADVDALAGTVTASRLRSECTSVGGGSSGSTKVTDGKLRLAGAEPVPLPADPAPNTTLPGNDAASGETFTIILNEQIEGSGAITVNALHVILKGPALVGNIVVGRSWCATGGARPPSDAITGRSPETGAPPATAGEPGAPGGKDGRPGSAATPAAAGAAVVPLAAATAVKGSACGFISEVGLFGGPQAKLGCAPQRGTPQAAANDSTLAPSVTLPATGSATAITAADANGASARYGPAVIVGGKWPCEDPGKDDDGDGLPGNCTATAPPTGPMDVSTEGTLDGTVKSTAHFGLHATPPTVGCYEGYGPVCTSPGGFGPFPVEGDEMTVTCSASETALTGEVTMKKAILATTTDVEGNPKEQETVPDKPPVNYTRSGVITNVGDVFTAVYNEHVYNDDGSLTVNGVHMYLFGPTAVGEVVKGQATCGRTPALPKPADKQAPSCGKLVVAPISPEDQTPKTPRTELIGVFDAGGLQSISNIQATNGEVKIGNPDGLPYLQFTAGQKGPITVNAIRSEEAEASNAKMTWSFDATDVAGNITRSTQCATDSERIGTVVDPTNPGGNVGGAGGTGTGTNTGTNTAGTGGSGAANSAAVMAKTGANVLGGALTGLVLIGGGVFMVRSSRRRRAAGGAGVGPAAVVPADGVRARHLQLRPAPADAG